MHLQVIFKFKADISTIDIPTKLNNPFGTYLPEIARLAAEEFQEFISGEFKKWNYDFNSRKG